MPSPVFHPARVVSLEQGNQLPFSLSSGRKKPPRLMAKTSEQAAKLGMEPVRHWLCNGALSVVSAGARPLSAGSASNPRQAPHRRHLQRRLKLVTADCPRTETVERRILGNSPNEDSSEACEACGRCCAWPTLQCNPPPVGTWSHDTHNALNKTK
jgi:hypothetical protein